MKRFAYLLIAAILGGLVAMAGSQWLLKDANSGSAGFVMNNTPAHFTNYSTAVAPPAFDFTEAANRTLPAVVHIRASGRVAAGQQFDLRQLPEPFRDFFGDRFGPQGAPDQLRQGTGSGVIISADGYIVTNNHVVSNADELQVTLNDKRDYTAKVIGTDPNTDVALIKIEEKGLPFIPFANSDNVKVGEWVVAVGNPFNLASTVTAGIVSAKGRSINILEGQAPIEAFIQTDAVVNPGNSGGALVNTSGELIGINTAIASPTGVFAGYAFAVPSNIVFKTIEDLKQYGVVQRAYLGAIIREVDGRFAREMKLSVNSGVYVDSLTENSAAAAAGIRKGDVIRKLDGVQTLSSSSLLEQIGRHRPGDRVTLTVLREGQERDIAVTLKNVSGTTEVVQREEPVAAREALGADMATLTRDEARQLGVEGGVKINSVGNGLLRMQTEIRDGFIITKVDRKPVRTVEELEKVLRDREGGVLIEGVYPGSSRVYYYGLGLQ